METEIVASRFKTTLFLILSLGFVALGLLLGEQNDHSLRWGTGFFALCSLVFIIQLVRPQKLSLDQEGLSLSGGLLRSPTKIAWRDVTHFFVVQIRPGTSMIGFNYSADASNKPRGAAFSRRIAGADGALSGVWAGSNASVVDKLNAYRLLATTSP
jgi:hypothetical protein